MHSDNSSTPRRNLIGAFSTAALALLVAGGTSAYVYTHPDVYTFDPKTQNDRETQDRRFFVVEDYAIAGVIAYGAYLAARPTRRRKAAPERDVS
jgi:hypothetical protein